MGFTFSFTSSLLVILRSSISGLAALGPLSPMPTSPSADCYQKGSDEVLLPKHDPAGHSYQSHLLLQSLPSTLCGAVEAAGWLQMSTSELAHLVLQVAEHQLGWAVHAAGFSGNAKQRQRLAWPMGLYDSV